MTKNYLGKKWFTSLTFPDDCTSSKETRTRTQIRNPELVAGIETTVESCTLSYSP